MIDIFELMNKKFNLLKKVCNIKDYIIKTEVFFWYNDFISFYDLFKKVFHKWEFNNCYSDLDEMLLELGIIKYIKNTYTGEYICQFQLSTKEQCCNFLQLFYNALDFMSRNFENPKFSTEFKVIQNKIDYVIEKANLKFIFDKRHYLLTDNNPLISNVAEKSDEETALKLLSYNEVENANNIEHKRQILKYLSNITEPITKGYDKKSGDKYNLYNNLDFALNNLNIRHNNKIGKNENEFIKNVDASTLIKYYDDTFNLIVNVLTIHYNKQSFIDIENLKNTFKS